MTSSCEMSDIRLLLFVSLYRNGYLPKSTGFTTGYNLLCREMSVDFATRLDTKPVGRGLHSPKDLEYH